MKLQARTLVFTLLAALVGALGAAESLRAQQGGSGRARVLVATFQTSDGIDDDLGREIAEKLIERVQDFDLLTAVGEDELEEALDRFELESNRMDLIQWRQLASRLNAQLIVYGEISSGSSAGNRVEAVFVEAGRGEETEVPEFTLQGDGGDAAERAAEQVATTLDRHVEFLSARLNCQDYLSSDQLEDAIRNCEQALEIRPNSTEALYLRGQIAVEQEDWQTAIEHLSQAVEQNASHEEALQSLAYAHAQAGDRERSVELYREYLEFNPDDQDVRLSVAYSLASAGAYPSAMKIIQDGLQRDSTSAALWKYLGDVALRQGTAADQAQVRGGSTISDTSAIRTALDAYQHFVSLRPDSANAKLYRNMANVQQTLGQIEPAIELVNEALASVDSAGTARASLWSKKADLLATQQDLAGAVAAMDSVLANDSDYQRARFKRGLFQLRQGNTEAAMSDFRSAVERGTPRNDISQSLFATGFQRYYKNGQFQRAARMFEAGLEFVEQQQLGRRLHFWAGYSWYRLGRNIDESNQEEACSPAQRAQRILERVAAHIDRAGDVQASNQQQIQKATEGLLYRQQQIQRKACQG